MNIKSCQLVPGLVLASLLCGGCFASYEVDSFDPPVTPPPDAMVPQPDTGTIPPPIPALPRLCGTDEVPTGSAAPDLAQYRGRVNTYGTDRLEIEVRIPGCYCDVRPACSGRYLPDEARIELDVALCQPREHSACEACEGSDYGPGVWATCEVDVSEGSLPRMEVDVAIGETVRFTVNPFTVSPPDVVLFELTPDSPEELLCPERGVVPRAETDVCVEDYSWPGQPTNIYLREPCGGCLEQPADCEVRVNHAERTITIENRHLDCADPVGGDCPAVCMPMTRICRTPVLEVLGEYLVIEGRRRVATFTVGDVLPERPEVTCAERLGFGG